MIYGLLNGRIRNGLYNGLGMYNVLHFTINKFIITNSQLPMGFIIPMGSINLDKFHHDLTVLPKPGIMVKKGNHPQMAQHFRLVNYYNFSRYMVILLDYYGKPLFLMGKLTISMAIFNSYGINVSAVPRQTELAKVISECAGPEAAWRQLPKESAPREVGVRSGAGCRAFEERPFARGRNGECAVGGWGEKVWGEN